MRRRAYVGVLATLAAAFEILAPDARVRVQPALAAMPKPAATRKPAATSKPTATPKPAATSKPSSSPTPTASPKSVVIGIALFRSGATNFKTDPYSALSDQLRNLGPFQPFIVGDKKCTDCSAGNAQIYVYAKRDPADDTDPNGSLTYTSYFVSGATVQRIASVPVQIDKDGNAVAPSDLNAKSLIGSLTFDENFQISINLPDSDQTLQLVPAPVNATDPDFEPILEHILEGRGVPAQRSRFTANALHGPRDTTTCPGAQRYLVYRVRLDQYPHKLRGFTFLEAYTEGFVLDCTAPAFVPAATGRFGKSLAQTSNLLNDFAALLIALKPKIQTAAMTGGISSFSKLVDVDPGTKDVQTTVAATALDTMVSNLCDRLDAYVEPSPSPSPTGARPTPTTLANSPLAKPSPIARVPLRCLPPEGARRQAKEPKPTVRPTALQAPNMFANGWFDAQIRSKPAPNGTPVPAVPSTPTP